MKKFFKLSLVMLMVMALLAGAVACGGGGNGEEDEGAEGEAEGDVLMVGTDTSFVPFEFEEDGEYKGFDIDLWAEIADRLDLEYELQPMDFNGLIPALQTGNIDLALAGMTITEEREEVVDFSMPYYDAGLLLLVRADEEEIETVEDLGGKVVASKTGTTSANFVEDLLNEEGIDIEESVTFDNISSAYMELEKGGADAVIFDSPAILYYIQTEGEGKVKTVGPLYQGQQYGIAYPGGSELRADVDEVLEEMMDDGTYDELYEKWFGEKPEETE